MAATDPAVAQVCPAADARPHRPSLAGSVLAAALALPGVLPGSLVTAQAEEAPEQTTIAAKYLSYRDRQPGLNRIKVSAPSLYLQTPLKMLGSGWSFDGSVVADQVSGASPRYHTAVSGASRMHDDRHAVDLKLSRHQERSGWSTGMAFSDEHDYRSHAFSAEYRRSTEDNNRTWNFGIGFSRDRIGSSNDPTLKKRRRTVELQAGVTQVWTRADIVQALLTVTRGNGFYNDVYKDPDQRPDSRRQTIGLVRWNHHVEGLGATLRTSYRHYRDSWKIRAHTLEAEWVQPVNPWLTVTPSMRYHSQSAASFYYDPVYDPDIGAPYPPGFFTNPPLYASPDQRLSAFGGYTVGLKVSAKFNPHWVGDLKLEHLEQRGSYKLGGNGSTGLDPFSATWMQLGVSYRY